MMYFFKYVKNDNFLKNNNNKFINIIDESNIEVIGFFIIVLILMELLILSV